MAERKEKTRSERPSTDDDLERSLEDAAEATRRPHGDADERERRREATERAERSPRRQGEGIHPRVTDLRKLGAPSRLLLQPAPRALGNAKAFHIPTIAPTPMSTIPRPTVGVVPAADGEQDQPGDRERGWESQRTARATVSICPFSGWRGRR